MIPGNLIETGKSFEQKYTPVLGFDDWMIAMLRQIEKTNPENFSQAEKHNETNEIFILTEGKAFLIVYEDGIEPGKEYIIKMEKSVAYNVPKSVWHSVVMSNDAHIVLIEKKNTTRENSNYHKFNADRINKIIRNFIFEV